MSIVYTMAVTQAAVSLSWPTHWAHCDADQRAILQRALQSIPDQGPAGTTPLAELLMPLLSRWAVVLDLASGHPAQPQSDGDVLSHFEALLSRLGLPSPKVVLQGVLQHLRLEELLAR